MKHLDIGSGLLPKKTYNTDDIYGIDIQNNKNNDTNYRQVNLFINKIPFDDNFFVVYQLMIF